MTGSESVNPRTRLTELSWGYRVSQALYVAARLGVFDVAAKGPKTADEIASIVGANEGAFDRLLSALTSVGVLYEDEEGRFHNSELGALLQADHPQSMQAVALMQGEPARWAAWGDLFETIRTGEPAFERIHGEPMFDYLQGRPEEALAFNTAMAQITAELLPSILEGYDFSGFGQIVDIGGGQGALLQGILARYRTASGVLFDLLRS